MGKSIIVMNIDTYQQFTPSTAIYKHAGTKSKLEAMYLGLGLNGEAGEVAEIIKKWYRDSTLDKDKLELEIGDVLWYISQLANCFDLDLPKVLIRNRDKLVDRQNRSKLQGSGDNR